MARRPAILTPERLRQRLLAYLQGRASTCAHTRRLYRGHIERAVAEGAAREPLVAAMEEAIAAAQRVGLLDDARYAEARARRGLARGDPPRKVAAALAAKGVSGELARAGVAAATDGDPLREACAAYVRRRRLGPWRRPEDRASHHAADLARLGRAGFPYAVARAALVAPDDEAD